MERKQKKPVITSVPQFGGWDHKAPEDTNYSMVFTQARANKKQMKTDMNEVKRSSIGANDADFGNANANHHQGLPPVHPPAAAQARPHVHAHANNVHASEDPVFVVGIAAALIYWTTYLGRRRFLTYINCCIRPY